ncbi:MAG TPA: hypothetical protein VFQ91_01660 [Bryobacteraceae bacterium]|nr:hypothetical protein [Bryobacteraceae bacterium]
MERVRCASDDTEIRDCAQQISKFGSRRATRGLLAIVRGSADPMRQLMALHTRWNLFDARAVPLFLYMGATGKTEDLRAVAVEGLGNGIRRRHVQEAVAKCLIDPSVPVRYSALCAAAWLRYVTRQPMIPSLRRALESSANDPASLYTEGDVAELARSILDQEC